MSRPPLGWFIHECCFAGQSINHRTVKRQDPITKMPWFCHAAPKRKRSSKARVGGIGKVRQADNSLSDNLPAFAVVLQSFASSIGDELAVQRGQVVEVMYHDGDWTFVRNLDAGSGYVPKVYCLSMDKVKGDFNNTMMNHISGPLPRPRVINVDTLQRSGSSVNSVEVHHVTSTSGTGMPFSEPTDTSASRTSSSSQAIYEVPKSPAQRYSCSQPTPEVSSQVTPSTRAPSLPPRSVCAPSPAEMQRQWAPSSASAHRPGFLPGCRQSNPFNMAAQGTPGAPPNQQSPVLRRSASQRSTPGKQAGNRSSPSSLPPQSGGDSASRQATPPAPSSARLTIHNPPLRPHPLNMGRTGSIYSHSGENSPNSIPTSARQSPGTRSVRNPSASPSLSQGRHLLGGVAAGRSHPQMRGPHRQTDVSDQVAHTPGPAGVPAVAPSPISARFAMTPGTPPTTTTPGCATTRTKLAATPSGASGVETNSQWPVRGADSTPPSCKQRAYSRRFRRHSSDIQDSCISEDSNVVTYHSPPQTVTRNHPRRQSQPCVAALGLHSPQQRPTRLPVQRSLSMQDPPMAMSATSCTTSVPIHRVQSYQEAGLSEDKIKFGATASLKPSEIIQQAVKTPGERSCDHERPSHSGRSAGKLELAPAAEPDDVFLPDTKKPCGIYRCTKVYQQTFKGEICLKKNELVIVLDHGRGEWAWAIKSNNEEGLIPKCVLVRYQSGLGVGDAMAGSGSLGHRRNRDKSDAGTQTDQDASACPDSSVVSCSSGSATVDAGSNAAITTGENSRNRRETRSASSETDAQLRPKEWFDTLDSVDAARVVTQIDSEPCNVTRPTPEQQTSRAGKPAAKGGGATVASKIPVRHRVRKTVSVPHDVSSSSSSAVTDSSRPQLVKSGTVHYHDRISGVGSVSFDSEASNIPPSAVAHNTPSTPTTPQTAQRPSPMLTAIKDYTPTATSSNCLPLERGDLLHLQPHMHYPKGWMWVWHTKRRSFGFVPKSAVAYTYNTPPRERRDTLEDAV